MMTSEAALGGGAYGNVNENPVYDNYKKQGLNIKNAPRTITLDDGTRKKVTGKQYSEFQKLHGEISYKLLSGLLQQPQFQNADEEFKKEQFNKMINMARSYSENKIFGKKDKNSPLYDREFDIDNIINEIPNEIKSEDMKYLKEWAQNQIYFNQP